MSEKKPDFFYLKRRVEWLEGKIARSDPNSPGSIFDKNELFELKTALYLLDQGPSPTYARTEKRASVPAEDEPPRMDMDRPFPKARPAKGRSRSRDVDERDFGGMFIPGGL